ncbi:DUF615 domain-containing protein [Mariprofundus erugo]|uniref:Dual-action ribosomal maturation protein DarP n=1 Tax=Mariprofundus erugo TaxID=2528639 RepID=A0A5R9GMT4_9PROT|nr:ribosome biogenesis factor YjgA [Mariprofundus erugo]TLS66269.1 DUF615 domain-containing protein [Mariprofundus erugo]
MYYICDEEYEPVERLNRSQQKRDIKVLHDLAVSLSRLEPRALARMDMPPELVKALTDVQDMKYGAEKRQFKFIVKLLRQIDTDSIVETITALEAKKSEQDKDFHRIERWRERLMSGDNSVLTEFMTAFPRADAGQIRQLIRNANNEIKSGKPPKSHRLLFRMLREVIAA